MTAPPTTVVIGWIGRKPPEGGECNKPSGICGYLDCAHENRCLEWPRMKPSQPAAPSPPAASLVLVRAQ
jgi:hypothetical protein